MWQSANCTDQGLHAFSMSTGLSPLNQKAHALLQSAICSTQEQVVSVILRAFT